MDGQYPAVEATLAGPALDLVIATWSDLAAEHRATGMYASQTSFARLVPYEGSPLKVAAANTAPYGVILEDGHETFHLPSVIDWSGPHVKVGRRGVPFLRIPFSHRTPGTQGVGSERARTMMPREVYRDALTVFQGVASARAVHNAAARLRDAGTIMSKVYAHQFPYSGSARTAQVLGELRRRTQAETQQPGYTWRARLYAGLRAAVQENPTTGRRSTHYYTIRTLAQDSLGWLIPAMPGYHFARRTVERVQDELAQLFGAAAAEDMVALANVAVGTA